MKLKPPIKESTARALQAGLSTRITTLEKALVTYEIFTVRELLTNALPSPPNHSKRMSRYPQPPPPSPERSSPPSQDLETGSNPHYTKRLSPDSVLKFEETEEKETSQPKRKKTDHQ